MGENKSKFGIKRTRGCGTYDAIFDNNSNWFLSLIFGSLFANLTHEMKKNFPSKIIPKSVLKKWAWSYLIFDELLALSLGALQANNGLSAILVDGEAEVEGGQEAPLPHQVSHSLCPRTHGQRMYRARAQHQQLLSTRHHRVVTRAVSSCSLRRREICQCPAVPKCPGQANQQI